MVAARPPFRAIPFDHQVVFSAEPAALLDHWSPETFTAPRAGVYRLVVVVRIAEAAP